MEEDKIRQLFEEIDPDGKIPSEKIDELIGAMKEQELHQLKDGDRRTYIDENGEEKTIVFHTLKEQLENETDWRKKASIAAKIISLGLE